METIFVKAFSLKRNTFWKKCLMNGQRSIASDTSIRSHVFLGSPIYFKIGCSKQKHCSNAAYRSLRGVTVH